MDLLRRSKYIVAFVTGALIATAVVSGFFVVNKDKVKPDVVYSEQIEICNHAAEISAQIARSAEDGKVSDEKRGQLVELYYGKAQIYLEQPVIDAVREVASTAHKCNKRKRLESECARALFNGLATNVAKSCRTMVSENLGIELGIVDGGIYLGKE